MRYECLSTRELPDSLKEIYGFDGDYRLHVVKYVDGKEPEVLGSDRGEPEDATFGRDYSWVIAELNRAFEEGTKA